MYSKNSQAFFIAHLIHYNIQNENNGSLSSLSSPSILPSHFHGIEYNKSSQANIFHLHIFNSQTIKVLFLIWWQCPTRKDRPSSPAVSSVVNVSRVTHHLAWPESHPRTDLPCPGRMVHSHNEIMMVSLRKMTKLKLSNIICQHKKGEWIMNQQIGRVVSYKYCCMPITIIYTVHIDMMYIGLKMAWCLSASSLRTRTILRMRGVQVKNVRSADCRTVDGWNPAFTSWGW